MRTQGLGGGVRVPPTVVGGVVYVGSDDGYCSPSMQPGSRTARERPPPAHLSEGEARAAASIPPPPWRTGWCTWGRPTAACTPSTPPPHLPEGEPDVRPPVPNGLHPHSSPKLAWVRATKSQIASYTPDACPSRGGDSEPPLGAQARSWPSWPSWPPPARRAQRRSSTLEARPACHPAHR